MSNDKWIAYLLIGLIAFTSLMIFTFESVPFLAIQLNSTVIIGLLITILIKIDKRQS